MHPIIQSVLETMQLYQKSCPEDAASVQELKAVFEHIASGAEDLANLATIAA